MIGPRSDVRTRRTLSTAVAVAFVLFAGAVPASADHQFGHTRPQGPAKVAFAEDFPALSDHEWGFALGGFGGVRRGAPRDHVPVIFVHGNNVDHADWYPVRDDFRAAGWSDQELWALSYNGLGCNNGSTPARGNPERDEEHREMGWDGSCRVTNNDLNVPDMHDFVEAVRTYTGSRRFSLVGHSLGVTVARKTLKEHPDLRRDLVAFVAIAGANHGTSLCAPGSEGVVMSCDEIAAGTDWLADLNGADGEDETYPPARWLTVYDGTGAGDVAFVGPTYADSPRLAGAEERTYPGTDHNALRIRQDIVADYRAFLEEAEAASPVRAVPAAPDRSAQDGPRSGADGISLGAGAERSSASELPTTGGGAAGALLAILLSATLRRRR